MSLYEYRATLVRWIDADTAVVDIDLGFRHWMHNEHLRLVGINAPDKQPAKSRATAYATYLAPPGTELTIATEKDKGDKYGRWLAWIYVGDVEDNIEINAHLVRGGYAVIWDGSGSRPEAGTA